MIALTGFRLLSWPTNSFKFSKVSPAIQEAAYSQHSLGRLCPMNQLNGVQNNPQQLHGDQRAGKFLSCHSKDA